MDKVKLLFEMYKDKPIGTKTFRGKIKKKYNLEISEVTELYTKIHNYQIEKYGQRLDKMVDCLTFDELRRRAQIVRCLHNQRFEKKK